MKSDEIVYYTIISNEADENYIKAWSRNKKIAEVYMKFHNCKHDKLKVSYVIDKAAVSFENEHSYSEISLAVLNTADKKGGLKTIVVPVTETDINFITTDTNTFFSSRIKYDTLNMVFPYFKDKYQKGLRWIFLSDVIEKVVHNKENNPIANSIDFDDLRTLIKIRNIDFGK
jgi:hypothetical protein